MIGKNVIILTGAGISAESGLGTFRDKDGIWTRYPLEDLATLDGFQRNPDFVHDFYNARRRQLKTSHPNPGHQALVLLEEFVVSGGGDFTLVTQNVDNLHEQAGSSPERLIHMHGELAKSRCLYCDDCAPCDEDLTTDTICKSCRASGGMRPHVVWFGEVPLEMERIGTALAACDTFISIGTSGDVYPAAGFVQMVRGSGAKSVELNLEPSSNAGLFSDAIYGLASEIVPEWVQKFVSHSR